MSNCVMKAILSLTLGTRAFGWFTTATLGAMIGALGMTLVIVW